MEVNYSKSPYTRGLENINKAFGKPDKRDLITLFGYMSSGKTEFSYFVARENVKLGVKVCYLSLELPEYDMKLRIARKSAGISKIDFQNQNFSEQQKQILDDKFIELDNQKDLLIVKPKDSTIQMIEKSIRYAYDDGFRMFIIDNLDKMSGEEDDNIRYQHISSVLQDLKNENNICIILIHHAKKPMNKQQQYMPAGMSGTRGSQKILDNSTQVIEIFRDLDPTQEDKRERSKVSLFQYKDTFDGSNGMAEIYFSKGSYYEQYPNPF